MLSTRYVCINACIGWPVGLGPHGQPKPYLIGMFAVQGGVGWGGVWGVNAEKRVT